MDRTYKYTVLAAIPDERRGERVNVGLVVFKDGLLDVRFRYGPYKLRALTGEDWGNYLEFAHMSLSEIYRREKDESVALAEFGRTDGVLKPSKLGWFVAANPDDYEKRVFEVMSSLIGPSVRERREQQSRINTEIAAAFRVNRILAGPGEGFARGRIVRNFNIDEREGLVADFALQNGKLHVATTLDLRKQTANLGQAALKAVVLDKSKQIFSNVRKIGVYALDEGMEDAFKPHLAIFGDYADDIYNWSDISERRKFQRSLYDALPPIWQP